MIRILKFDAFNNISEKIMYITANWQAISNEASFDKKIGSGYFIFNESGVFSVVYSKSGEEESRLDFYVSKEASSDGNTLCSCKILNKDGKVVESKKFQEINGDTIWHILSLFFDYSDLEKEEKSVVDRFLLGFTKSLKVIFAHDSEESLPSSFRSFSKQIQKYCKESPKLEDSELDYKHKILRLLKDFINFYNKTI